MKKLILLVISIILMLPSAIGQSLSRLDNNNGFRQFKFGMSPDQIKNLKKSKRTMILKDVVDYKYIGDEINTLYSVKTDDIILSFYKNQLYSIRIGLGSIFRKYEDYEFEFIQNALKSTFGNPNHNCDNGEKDTLNCFIWDAEKVICQHIRLNLSEPNGSRNKEYNYISGYLLFNYIPLIGAQQQGEF